MPYYTDVRLPKDVFLYSDPPDFRCMLAGLSEIGMKQSLKFCSKKLDTDASQV